MQKSTIYRNPLTDEQKQNNRIKSKDRCRIEHIFGFVEGAMNGSLVRSIGMMRAKAANALTNLVYNIFRYVQINHYQPQLITTARDKCAHTCQIVKNDMSMSG